MAANLFFSFVFLFFSFLAQLYNRKKYGTESMQGFFSVFLPLLRFVRVFLPRPSGEAVLAMGAPRILVQFGAGFWLKSRLVQQGPQTRRNEQQHLDQLNGLHRSVSSDSNMSEMENGIRGSENNATDDDVVLILKGERAANPKSPFDNDNNNNSNDPTTTTTATTNESDFVFIASDETERLLPATLAVAPSLGSKNSKQPPPNLLQVEVSSSSSSFSSATTTTANGRKNIITTPRNRKNKGNNNAAVDGDDGIEFCSSSTSSSPAASPSRRRGGDNNSNNSNTNFVDNADDNSVPRNGGHINAAATDPNLFDEEVYRRANEAVAAEMRRQLAGSRQLGLHVVVYHRGYRVIDVVGGVRRCARSGKWIPLEPNDLFMSFSVCKGIAATALLAAADRGELAYDQPVSSVWPGFSAHGREVLTIEDAISHRDGVRKQVPLPKLIRALASETPHERVWKLGTQWVENCAPDWTPGTRASYSPLNWGFILGTILENATGRSIDETVHEDIALPLGRGGQMYLGKLPCEEFSRVAFREPTVNFDSAPKPGLLKRILAGIEARLMCAVGNAKWWSKLCLPSSNGYFTADAVASMYGALANGGRIFDGDVERVLVSPATIDELMTSLTDEEKVLHPPFSAQKLPARMSRGYGPWPFPSHQGENAHRCFGHSGLGGCIGFADPDAQIGICVMKTGYDPHMAVGAAGSTDSAKLCLIVKECLKGPE